MCEPTLFPCCCVKFCDCTVHRDFGTSSCRSAGMTVGLVCRLTWGGLQSGSRWHRSGVVLCCTFGHFWHPEFCETGTSQTGLWVLWPSKAEEHPHSDTVGPECAERPTSLGRICAMLILHVSVTFALIVSKDFDG